MAQKNFSQMTTKKLNALLATANDEDKAAIQAVLEAREQAQTPTAQEAPIDEAPVAQENAPEENAASIKRSKMTDEERHALAESLKANINHRCQVVPFMTIEWVDGYIAGVIEEKRSNKVLYAIKTDDGRRIVKVHDSNLIRIFDETIEPEKKVRTRKSSVEKADWTPEAIAEEISGVIDNVGKIVSFEKYRTTDENGEEHIEMVSGRIASIVPDKRSQRLLYRIEIPAPIEGNPLAVKVTHKVAASEGLQIAEEFDEVGEKLNAAYRTRRENAVSKTPLTPQDRVIRCEENLKKAEEKLRKAQEELETKKKQLEDAKNELDAYLTSQENAIGENTAPAGEAEEDLA